MYLIRHGPTSSSNLILGQSDLPLDNFYRGKILQYKISSDEDPIVITSPLRRARETAELFGYHNPMVDDRIAEMDLGDFQGKIASAENMQKLIGLENDPDNHDHGGESVSEFFRRISEFYHEYRNSKRDVIVFTHSGVIRTIVSKINELMPKTYQPNYLEIVKIDHENKKMENKRIEININQ